MRLASFATASLLTQGRALVISRKKKARLYHIACNSSVYLYYKKADALSPPWQYATNATSEPKPPNFNLVDTRVSKGVMTPFDENLAVFPQNLYSVMAGLAQGGG